MKIANITEEQTVIVPRDREEAGRYQYTLTLDSIAELTSFSRTVTDEGTGRYFAFRITLAEPLRPGEYKYTITRAGAVVSQGLASVIGNPPVSWKENRRDSLKFKEYAD